MSILEIWVLLNIFYITSLYLIEFVFIARRELIFLTKAHTEKCMKRFSEYI